MKIGLYIHIPFCTAKCCYCDFASVSAGLDTQKKYVQALKREIWQKCAETDKKYLVETVFIGGGTPSVLYRYGLTEIINEVKMVTDFVPTEFTVEANPESVTAEFVDECKSIGVNRISLGLQTASADLLKTCRRHTYNDFLQSVELIQKADITNISADIMLGLPNQTLLDVKETVRRLVALNLPHISAYGLKVEDGTPLGKSGYTPNDDNTAAFYESVYRILTNPQNITDEYAAAITQKITDKYIRYEVSNFAKSGFECEHNIKYWTLQPYLGIGLHASSYLNQKRLTNTRNLNQYLEGQYTDFCEDVSGFFLTEYIMLGLRTNRGIDINALAKNGLNIFAHAGFKKYINMGALRLSGEKIILNDDYYFIMNSIVSELI